MTEFRTPRPLAAGDKLSDFRCGEESLDSWLRGRARSNEKSGAPRTMVSVTREGRVAGYYCLSSSALDRGDGPPPLAVGMPVSVPIVLLGRLAVDREYAGRGLGVSLLQHATMRALEAADAIGVRAILVHAINDEVVPFYERFGFERFPGAQRSLFLLAQDARATLSA
ncbi:GNAT family N-acetyltransferase [Microbacterium oxydans]|uniref:GNAT family N-acetyltransferase n=1 Tax=Microbacterium oxydans TaxID=82380 RepID=UPI0022B183FD|nr:GNAT family N-acetyltransferase [Microbacterium oxydans]MCZ4302670.1 GNAT family N-acetyltransferase [Microbacterium oxydans]